MVDGSQGRCRTGYAHRRMAPTLYGMTTKTTRRMVTVCYDATKRAAPLHRVVGNDQTLCGTIVTQPEIFDAEASYVAGLECAACSRITG